MNFPAHWELRIDRSVKDTLKRIPRHDMIRIMEVFHTLPKDPYFGDIKKMKGEPDVWRRRIGSFRIFYRIKLESRLILVFRVERRTSKTY